MTVTSDRGDFIEDLQLHDVRVFEDDVEQDIDRLLDQNAPSTLALLIDVSGSMRLEIEDIKSALMSFLARIRAETKVLVATFDDRILVHAEPTTDLRTLVGAITHIERGIGSRLHDAIEIVVTERLNELPGRKAIVMLTDGVDTRSRLSTAAQSLSRASEGQIAIHVLQYDTSDANRLMSFPSAFSPVMSPPGATGMTGSYTAALKNLVGLTEATGGLTYWAPTVAGVKNALNRIATELNEQYAVAYYPFNVARDGSYRKIRVDVLRPGVTVRARKGYRAPSVP
jgi:Ca-activated chloride channel family protein